MNVSLIIVCGYLDNSELEKDRLLKFLKCLKAINKIPFLGKDEVIISEYGNEKKLEKIVSNILKVPYQYVFTKKEDKFYNQSIAKNVASELSNNEILFYINSDIILQNNCFEVIKSKYQNLENKFIVCARHDVFLQNEEVDQFIDNINIESNYHLQNIKLQDPGWYYALKILPKDGLDLHIKAIYLQNYHRKIMFDFMSGYFVFGDYMVMTKEMYNNCKFDEGCYALTDVYLRDRLLHLGYPVEFIHNETSCFHLCGIDYMGQMKEDDPKRERLHNDQQYLTEKYPELRHWLVFGFHKENILQIMKYYSKEEVADIINNYRTEVFWKYFDDKDYFCSLFDVSPEL